jgi:hypothetical protein
MKYLRETEVVESYVARVTPQLAETLLKDNSSNRRINGKRVTSYSKTIKDGEWKLTGQPIILSEDGSVIDGQHRLYAVIVAGRAIDVLIVKLRATDDKGELTALNVPVDIGYRRNISNITGRSPREVSITRTMVHYFEEGGQALASRPEVIIDRFNVFEEVITKYAKVNQTPRTRVGAMVGFIMADIAGFDSLEMVNNVALNRYEKLTPIWGSFVRSSDRITNMIGSSYILPSMALAWRIKDATGSILRVHNYEKAINEMAKLYNLILKA